MFNYDESESERQGSVYLRSGLPSPIAQPRPPHVVHVRLTTGKEGRALARLVIGLYIILPLDVESSVHGPSIAW